MGDLSDTNGTDRRAVAWYRVRVGVNYHPHGDRARAVVRREAGARVNDLPPAAVAWLVAAGCIVPDAGPDGDGEAGDAAHARS